MLRKISGWILAIFGAIGALLGIMATIGGEGFYVGLKIISLSLIVAGAGVRFIKS